MRTLRITTVGAWCAILMFPVLIIGGVLLSSSGAADLLPPTGKPGRDWLLAVAGEHGLFAAGAWLLIHAATVTYANATATDLVDGAREMYAHDLDRLRMVLDLLLSVELVSPGQGARHFNPETVRISWRT